MAETDYGATQDQQANPASHVSSASDEKFLLLGSEGSEFMWKAMAAFAVKKIDFCFQPIDISKLDSELAPPHTMPQCCYAGISGPAPNFGLLTDSTDILELLDGVAPAEPLFPADHPDVRQLHDDICTYFTCYTRYYFIIDYEGRWRSFGPRIADLVPCGCGCRCLIDMLLNSTVERFKGRLRPIMKEHGVDVDDSASVNNGLQKAPTPLSLPASI